MSRSNVEPVLGDRISRWRASETYHDEASKCGFTPQYNGLQNLYEQFQPRGFEILAFPCDQFGHQEPGSDAEIATFCDAINFLTDEHSHMLRLLGIDFGLLAMASVKLLSLLRTQTCYILYIVRPDYQVCDGCLRLGVGAGLSNPPRM